MSWVYWRFRVKKYIMSTQHLLLSSFSFITSRSYPSTFPILPPSPQRCKPAEAKHPLKTKSLNWLKLHSSVCSLRFVEEWGWCYGLFGKCPLRTGTVNDCFPLSPTDRCQVPCGHRENINWCWFPCLLFKYAKWPLRSFQRVNMLPKVHDLFREYLTFYSPRVQCLWLRSVFIL